MQPKPVLFQTVRALREGALGAARLPESSLNEFAVGSHPAAKALSIVKSLGYKNADQAGKTHFSDAPGEKLKALLGDPIAHSDSVDSLHRLTLRSFSLFDTFTPTRIEDFSEFSTKRKASDQRSFAIGLLRKTNGDERTGHNDEVLNRYLEFIDYKARYYAKSVIFPGILRTSLEEIDNTVIDENLAVSSLKKEHKPKSHKSDVNQERVKLLSALLASESKDVSLNNTILARTVEGNAADLCRAIGKTGTNLNTVLGGLLASLSDVNSTDTMRSAVRLLEEVSAHENQALACIALNGTKHSQLAYLTDQLTQQLDTLELKEAPAESPETQIGAFKHAITQAQNDTVRAYATVMNREIDALRTMGFEIPLLETENVTAPQEEAIKPTGRNGVLKGAAAVVGVALLAGVGLMFTGGESDAITPNEGDTIGEVDNTGNTTDVVDGGPDAELEARRLAALEERKIELIALLGGFTPEEARSATSDNKSISDGKPINPELEARLLELAGRLEEVKEYYSDINSSGIFFNIDEKTGEVSGDALTKALEELSEIEESNGDISKVADYKSLIESLNSNYLNLIYGYAMSVPELDTVLQDSEEFIANKGQNAFLNNVTLEFLKEGNIDEVAKRLSVMKSNLSRAASLPRSLAVFIASNVTTSEVPESYTGIPSDLSNGFPTGLRNVIPPSQWFKQDSSTGSGPGVLFGIPLFLDAQHHSTGYPTIALANRFEVDGRPSFIIGKFNDSSAIATYATYFNEIGTGVLDRCPQSLSLTSLTEASRKALRSINLTSLEASEEGLKEIEEQIEVLENIRGALRVKTRCNAMSRLLNK